ncbi:hypothetical protein Pyn_20161 [Prunus yedoensis var. nudiflora]|uniref:Uncharacterized protein n=1 Tax=Prunus yedoensis var. nudiflora TaxID=2094558 RepID=A0A314YEI1_PRUYE|nr:hypothetical protein Pyn_20161 [Prunus yedoensis var. nudiflora]
MRLGMGVPGPVKSERAEELGPPAPGQPAQDAMCIDRGADSGSSISLRKSKPGG